MEPGERVNLIQSIATTFTQNEMSWDLIDVALDEFGAEPNFHTEPGPQRTLYRVRSLPDSKLVSLHAHLHPDESVATPLPSSEEGGPWKPDHFRLFISHTSAHKSQAGAMALFMERAGIQGFVAHTTIEPTSEWADVIVQALQSCHAMVAMLTPDFPQSKWCDQEVGVAVDRGILIVPVRMGIDPYGFIGRYQGLTLPPRTSLGPPLFDLLAKHPLTRTRMVDPIIRRFAASGSFDGTRAAWPHIKSLPREAWTDERSRIVREAARTNSQVRNANLNDGNQTPVAKALEAHLLRLGVEDPDDIPF